MQINLVLAIQLLNYFLINKNPVVHDILKYPKQFFFSILTTKKIDFNCQCNHLLKIYNIPKNKHSLGKIF